VKARNSYPADLNAEHEVRFRPGRYKGSCVISIFFLMLVGAGGMAGCNPGAETDAALPSPAESALAVQAEPVMRQDWIVTVPASGSLRTLSSVEVKPEVGGRLIATYFEEGDLVGKDQLIAEIDPVNYRLAYDQAAAALAVAQVGVERAKVSAEHARTERERADNLLGTGGITQRDHQAAVTAVREAETQVRLAEAQCEQARTAMAISEKALKDCKIFSPISGHVQKRILDKGSLLSPGSSLCVIVDNARLELECVIPSYVLASIKLGQHAAFTTPTYGERQFEGTVSAISPVIEPDSRSAKVRLKIANPGGELRSGMYARGAITTAWEKGVLVISRDSLIAEKEGSESASVFIVREGRARRAEIGIGSSQQDRVWIKRGLREGELVIKEIGPSLKDGIPVKLQK
jgi:membrane fusion protein, multidrug efflux system